MTDVRRYWSVTLHLRGWQRVLLVGLTALILVQTVGLLHRVAHVQPRSVTLSHTSSAVVQNEANLFAAIWGDHSTSAECQLFDQACPDLLQVPVWALPAVSVMPIWTTLLLLERFALFERFYAARGPPAALL